MSERHIRIDDTAVGVIHQALLNGVAPTMENALGLLNRIYNVQNGDDLAIFRELARQMEDGVCDE